MSFVNLVVTSVAGSATGSTIITVEPILTGGNSYKYKIAANPTIPAAGQKCVSGYTVWDGISEIVAESGKKIVIAEVGADNTCISAGMTTIVSAD